VVIWLPALFHGGRAAWSLAPALARITLVWLLASGTVHVLNDVIDRKRDESLPHARKRPLAAGEISLPEALVALALLFMVFLVLFVSSGSTLQLYLALYVILNVAYSFGLKRITGIRQFCIAIGFWLRLKSGASPVVEIPLTIWASIFTLSLAYHLNCLKGLAGWDQQGGQRRFIQMAAGLLAGALALVALTSVCIKRGMEGSLPFPEFPPLLCLLAMHRSIQRALAEADDRDQVSVLLGDPVILAALAGFITLFLIGST
jgi:hypothetical protein